MSARVEHDRLWMWKHCPDLAEHACETWKKTTPCLKYGMTLPWRTLRMRIDDLKTRQAELCKKIDAKKASEGGKYKGGGLLELCVCGSADWYLLVDRTLTGTGKAYAALHPSYTVVVYRNPCPTEPRYQCMVNAEHECGFLTCTGYVGQGESIEESVEDWKTRLTRWEVKNKRVVISWPHPKPSVPPETEHSFNWMPGATYSHANHINPVTSNPLA